MAITQFPQYSAIPYSKAVAMPQNFLQPSDYDALKPFILDADSTLHQPFVDSITGFIDAVVAKKYSHSQVIEWGENRETNIVIEGASFNIGTGVITTTAPHKLRKGIVVNLSDGSVVNKGRITVINSATTFTVVPYESAFTIGASDITIVEAYTDFLKGSYGMEEGLDPEYDFYTNTKQIVKDSDIVALTDSAEVLKLEVDGGFLWTFHKNAKTMKRFENKREAAFLDGKKAASGSAVAGLGLGNMMGAFEQVRSRGMTYGGHPTTHAEWQDIFAELDKIGAIANYALWLNTQFDFDFSDAIADTSEIGYGVFQNGKDEAYSYDMRGFDMGGYNIYKKKWNYLINRQGMGALKGAGVPEGLMFPLGNSNVFDKITGKVESLPYLHVETARDADGHDRWAYINPNAADADLDAKKVTYLSEFATKCVGAQNFVLFETVAGS